MFGPDLINGTFETLGGFAVLGHIRALLRDKQVKGVSWPVVVFFCLWGYWNLFYYPHLGQWYSFLGGMWLALTNTVWVAVMVYYVYFERAMGALNER